MTLIFANADKRAAWEIAFVEAKQALAASADRQPPPEFLFPLPIRKTRAGLQFTCASSSLGCNAYGFRDVWVCNSDGYVGQVCVLSLQPEPTVTSCNGVCNARILCLASVPAAQVSSPPSMTSGHSISSSVRASIVNEERLSMSSDETVTSSSGCYSSSVLSSGATPTPSCPATPPPTLPVTGGTNTTNITPFTGNGGPPTTPTTTHHAAPTLVRQHSGRATTPTKLKSLTGSPMHQPLFQLDSDSSDDEDEQVNT